MHQRCRKEASYITKGIKVCEEWKKYLVFKAWALENGYQKGLELDRKENHLGYSPSNCRWITHTEQQRNLGRRRDNKASIYKGVQHPSPNRWTAKSEIGGIGKWLGSFSSEIEAAQAYDDYVFSIDPEHAYLNFPKRLRDQNENKRNESATSVQSDNLPAG